MRNLRETGAGSARQLEEQWVKAEKQLDDEQKKSLKMIRVLFFDNPSYKNEEPEYIASQLAPGQLKNTYDGALAILKEDRNEVQMALGVTDGSDWERYYGAALEIKKCYEELPAQADKKAVA